MTWDHRVIFEEVNDEEWYSIYEVYYNHDGSIEGWTAASIEVCSETPEGLRWQLERMLMCLEKPVLCVEGDTLVEKP